MTGKAIATMDRFVAGDWGSTAMRLHLCERRGDEVVQIDHAAGSGVKFCDDFEAAFFDAAGAWFERDGALPVILAGMIGSNLGWVDCPYAACPADASALAAHVRRFTARGVEIGIVPGLRCTNIFGLPDVMRGEEVQIFGLLAHPGMARGRHIVCLPGTHAKWVVIEDGVVQSFFTSMQGEMFEILLAHSLVGRGLPQGTQRRPILASDTEFGKGVTVMIDDPSLATEHAVFAARSRFVTGDLAAEDAPAFLSGLLIGAEAFDALGAFGARGLDVDAVTLVGAEGLMPLYALALERLGVAVRMVPAHSASIAGLSALVAAHDPAAAR